MNDQVAAGTVILRLRSTEQVAGLSQAQAALKEATAREREAQQRYDRIHDMYQRKVVAKATFDEATAARDAAVAQLRRRAPGSMRPAKASRTRSSARLTPGVVTQKLVQVGEAVAPGTPAHGGRVARCAAGRHGNPAEHRRAGARSNKADRATSDGRAIESTGLTLFPAAQPQTNTFRARIDLPKRRAGLAPGMFVKVGLVTGRSRPAARCRAPPSSNAARCARCMSWARMAA